LEQLRDAVRAGQRFKYLCFWGHQPQADGSIGPTCLSQWFVAPFTVDDVPYPTAEHFMMAEKARLFGDSHTLERILGAASPGEAKKLGRAVTPWDQDTWAAHRSAIVVRASVGKFRDNAPLREFLVRTGDRVLVEASPRDRIWGIGMGKNNPSAENPLEWRGSNLLGFALMEARAQLST
jgi:ribA/ribD-fused uncharacterized protein